MALKTPLLKPVLTLINAVRRPLMGIFILKSVLVAEQLLEFRTNIGSVAILVADRNIIGTYISLKVFLA